MRLFSQQRGAAPHRRTFRSPLKQPCPHPLISLWYSAIRTVDWGSGAAMTTGPEAGYYADPSIPGYIRYWDGTQWVPGTSRPAPDQTGFDQTGFDQSESQQAVVQETAAVRDEPWQQNTGTQAAVQAAAQVRDQLVATAQPVIMVEQEPTEPEPVQDPYATQTVSTMVVPSAFATSRTGYGNPGWSGSTAAPSGYDASPYAAVPGLNGQPEAEPAGESEVRVVELASAGSRILARIIDLAIAAVLSSPATATLLLIAHRHDHAYVEQLRIQAKTTYRTLGLDATGIALWAASLVVLLLASMLIDAVRIGRGGQTPGRRLVGVQVVTADTASEVGGAAAFTRALLFWIFALLPVLDILALGGVLWGRPYRQGLHEKLTRTISIRA